MKTFQKFFRYSRKLEELQTARKAKEVDEVRKFDIHMEAQKQQQLAQHLKSERIQVKHQKSELESPLISEQAWKEHQNQHLQEVKAFDRYAQHTKIRASDNELEQMIALQESLTEPSSDASPALPSVTYNLFADEVTDITEQEFQRELQHNHDAIYANQPPERKTFSQPSKPETPDTETDEDSSLEDGLTIVDDEPAQEEGNAKKPQETKAPAPGNVFYFRKPHPPSSEK